MLPSIIIIIIIITRHHHVQTTRACVRPTAGVGRFALLLLLLSSLWRLRDHLEDDGRARFGPERAGRLVGEHVEHGVVRVRHLSEHYAHRIEDECESEIRRAELQRE